MANWKDCGTAKDAGDSELRSGELTADDPLFDVVLDLRIAEMHRLLDAMAPASTTSALNSLREAFPDAPLEERVRALSRTSH